MKTKSVVIHLTPKMETDNFPEMLTVYAAATQCYLNKAIRKP